MQNTKDYFVIKNFALNVGIKAYWYTKDIVDKKYLNQGIDNIHRGFIKEGCDKRKKPVPTFTTIEIYFEVKRFYEKKITICGYRGLIYFLDIKKILN